MPNRRYRPAADQPIEMLGVDNHDSPQSWSAGVSIRGANESYLISTVTAPASNGTNTAVRLDSGLANRNTIAIQNTDPSIDLKLVQTNLITSIAVRFTVFAKTSIGLDVGPALALYGLSGSATLPVVVEVLEMG